MKYTDNYGLKMPEATDAYNVEDFNENIDAVDKELKNHSDKVYQICNENMVPNILPLADNVEKNISIASTAIASVDLLGDTVKWILKISSANTKWQVLLGDIGEGTDDGNYGGVCKRYIGYNKPSGVGGQCYGLYIKLESNDCTFFPAGQYTLSYWVCIEGGSTNNCPYLLTSEPTSALGVALPDIISGKWQRVEKTFTINSNTDVLYVILDSIAPGPDAARKLRFADIKLEYGSVATRFNPDYSKEMIMNFIANL